MRKKLKKLTASAMAALMLASSFSCVVGTSVFADDPSAEPDYVTVEGTQDVTKTKDITINLPDNVFGKYTVNSYKILQMVRPVDDEDDPSEIEPDKDTGLYCVTKDFEDFFKGAKTDLADMKKDATFVPGSNKNLYLTYNETTNTLVMTSLNADGVKSLKESGTAYIEIAYEVDFDINFF